MASIIDLLKEIKFYFESSASIKSWKKRGCPVPPPSYYKNVAIRKAKNKYRTNCFVETGTFLGNTTEIQRRAFDTVYSIELSIDLYKRATKRFANHHKVFILQGDSANVLPEIIKTLNQNTLFWLDAHYSGVLGGEQTSRADKDCPIYEELAAIFNNMGSLKHVILIDDAREFVGQNSYPAISDLRKYVCNTVSDYNVVVEHDIIYITPQ